MTFGPTTATVVNRGWDGNTKDRQNNPVISELGTFDLAGCAFQQLSAAEDLQGRDTTETLYLLLAPPPGAGDKVGHIDHFRIDAASINVDPDEGQTYATFEQDGEPDYLQHIDGTTHHLELILRRVRL